MHRPDEELKGSTYQALEERQMAPVREGRAGPRISQLLALIAALLVPVLVITLILNPSIAGNETTWLSMLILSTVVWIVALIALRAASKRSQQSALIDHPVRMLYPDEQPEVVKQVMNVSVATEQGGVNIFKGFLKTDPDHAYSELKRGRTSRSLPLLQKDDDLEAAVIFVPESLIQTPTKPIRPWLHWLLFVLTLGTTTIAGARIAGVDVFATPEKIAAGLPYAIALLAVLGLHELGHYFTAKRYHMDVTPPYFMPVPFWLGTFGAFIQMRSPSENRRVLFDTAIAGPLTGIAIALPILFIGLQMPSTVDFKGALDELLQPTVGSSILFTLIAEAARGQLVYGEVIKMSPVAFAGWIGVLITALNMIPIGELDGGHVSQAMFGRRVGSFVSMLASLLLLYIGIFVWPSLLLFAVMVIILAGKQTPPLNDLSEPGSRRYIIGLFGFILLFSILAPMPKEFFNAF